MVIYFQSAMEIGRLRLGQKGNHTTRYDWDRVTVKRTGGVKDRVDFYFVTHEIFN